MVDGTSYSDGNVDDEHFTNTASTGPRSVVVSASDCESEGLGFESHPSHVGFFNPGWLLPRAGSAMGPMESWNHTAERHPLHGCIFESVALIT